MKFVSIIGTVLVASAVSAVPCQGDGVSMTAQATAQAGGNPPQQSVVPNNIPKQQEEEEQSNRSSGAARPERPVRKGSSDLNEQPPKKKARRPCKDSTSVPGPNQEDEGVIPAEKCDDCNKPFGQSPTDDEGARETSTPERAPDADRQKTETTEEGLPQDSPPKQASNTPDGGADRASGANPLTAETTKNGLPEDSPSKTTTVPDGGAETQKTSADPPAAPPSETPSEQQPSAGSGQPKSAGQEALPKQQPSAEVLSQGTEISATPHQQFSSSIGVLGCKVDTRFVAYWPEKIGCDNICVEVTYEGRSVYLLRIDNSGGAHDISYDAFNYLATGKYASEGPGAAQSFGALPMKYTTVEAAKCKHLLNEGVLPMSAPTGSGLAVECPSGRGDWGDLIRLYNIYNPRCTLGKDEPCSFDRATNQFDCGSSKLGDQSPITDPRLQVWDVEYPTGRMVNGQ